MEKLSIYVNKRTATAECGCNGGGGSYSWANAKKNRMFCLTYEMCKLLKLMCVCLFMENSCTLCHGKVLYIYLFSISKHSDLHHNNI